MSPEAEQALDELKACPFCGKEPAIHANFAICVNDDCEQSDYWTGLEVDTWNTRPIEDALNARIAELELRLDVYNGNMYDVVVDSLFKANKRIAELEAERRWIPVGERLPEEKQDDAGETVDEWGKPDWVGKDVRK